MITFKSKLKNFRILLFMLIFFRNNVHFNLRFKFTDRSFNYIKSPSSHVFRHIPILIFLVFNEVLLSLAIFLHLVLIQFSWISYLTYKFILVLVSFLRISFVLFRVITSEPIFVSCSKSLSTNIFTQFITIPFQNKMNFPPDNNNRKLKPPKLFNLKTK